MSKSRRQRDKSMSVYIGRSDEGWVTARVGNDFTDGHRGMARAVRGAKKFVRSRVRAKNKQALRREFTQQRRRRRQEMSMVDVERERRHPGCGGLWVASGTSLGTFCAKCHTTKTASPRAQI